MRGVKKLASDANAGENDRYPEVAGLHLEIRPTETPEYVRAELVGERILGPTGMREILINTAILVFYILLLSIPIISYAFVSGGMRWIIVLLAISFIGLYTIYVMNLGIQKKKPMAEKPGKKLFSGELSRIDEMVQRASVGYSFSQQQFRELVAEALIEKIRLGRGLSFREMERMLERKKDFRELVADEELADFILTNWKKAEGWSDRIARKKSDREKKASGRQFMVDLNHILKKAEAWE